MDVEAIVRTRSDVRIDALVAWQAFCLYIGQHIGRGSYIRLYSMCYVCMRAV